MMEGENDSSDHVVIEMADLETSTNSAEEEETAPPPSDPTGGGSGTGPSLVPSPSNPGNNVPNIAAAKKTGWTASTALARQHRDEEFDTEMLRRAIADTGRWAFGTISVEAWVLDETTGKLVRPPRAFWFCEVTVAEMQRERNNEALARLVDETRDDFVNPDPLAPGVGLAGVLWSELERAAPSSNLRGSIAIPGGRRSSMGMFNETVNDVVGLRRIAWRETVPICNDPDQPYNFRLQLAVQAGIGLVAGVRFQFRNTQGLVVYMARSSTDRTKLRSEVNEAYLLSAADVIGSIASLREPRRVRLEESRAEWESVRIRVRNKMIAVLRMGGTIMKESLKSGTAQGSNIVTPVAAPTPGEKAKEEKKRRGPMKYIKGKVKLVLTKWKGANNAPPPPFTTRESLWSFIGCFLTLLSLLTFSEAITKRNPDYSLVTGPFGALMTLQYCLTAAPASQPRNAILGQAISLAVAIGFVQTRLEKKIRQSLGTSLAIFLMARLGVIHPPAGAAALIFSGGGYDWGHYGIMIAGNLIAIFFATVINDLNVRRQYPTFWGFGYWKHHFFPNIGKSKGEKSA